MPSHGFSWGIPSSYWPDDDITLLPAEAPPPPGESSNQQCSHLDILLCMRYISRPDLLWPSFLFQLLKSKQLTFTNHTDHIHDNSCITGKCVWGMPHIPSCLHLILTSLDACVYGTNFVILFKMADWMFEDALAAIRSPDSILISVLQSAGGLRLGDICFAKIQTTLHMRTVPIAVLKKWAVDGSFNLEKMAEGDYSCTTTILIILSTNPEGTALESASVRLIVQRCMGPMGSISTITKVINCAHSLIEIGWQTSNPGHRMIYTIVGNYGGHMAFTTDPLFCTAYPWSFVCQDDPAHMNFRSLENHPVSFNADGLLVHQLLMRDCPLHEYMMERCHGCFLVPRGLHFLPNLFPHILIPRNHVTPYRDPQMGEDVPFATIGPFVSTDTLFPGSAGDPDLYTDEEVIVLMIAWVFKSLISGRSTPKLPSLACKVESDSSTRKWDHRSSTWSHKCPVSAAAGSCEDLDKSEHEHEATRKQLHWEIDAEHGHPKSRDLTHGHITGDERGPTLKCGRSVDTGTSGEHPCPKERCAERGRSHKHRHINSPEHLPPSLFLSTPATPRCATTGSLCTLSLDTGRGSLPLDRGGMGTEVPVSSAGMVTPSNAHQPVLSSGQLANTQVGSVIATSGLTEAQSEEIFLLSRKVQTLHGKLALDFIQLSHQEALFRMGSQATGHEKATQGHPYHSMDKCDEPPGAQAKGLGWTPTLYSSIML